MLRFLGFSYSFIGFGWPMRHHVPGAVSAASGFGQSTGHTDLGTITLLFRQPIAGLQILGEDGNWAYVSSDR